MYAKRDLKRLGFRFAFTNIQNEVEIAYPAWQGRYRNRLRVCSQNQHTQLAVARPGRGDTFDLAYDWLLVIPQKGAGYKTLLVAAERRGLFREAPRYREMIVSAIYYAREMIRAAARREAKQRRVEKEASPRRGEYYEIHLTRGAGENLESTFIGVGLQGQVVSYQYYDRRQCYDIQQYNGLDAESLARQMVTGCDPVWKRCPS